ncbi:MAG: hypothetical protein RBR35_12750 [Salinivirgaceae bacterium]|nr:hypothetical protein [Salinivirgaceae bacterium]
MYIGTKKSLINVNISNIPGWRTNRKIVVIESDDWGSIRMSSENAFQKLLKAGVPVDKSHYNLYDSLESNLDLEMFMQVLEKFNDKTGRPPVITGVNIVANPDFEKIKENGFSQYVYEPISSTLTRYPEHDRVLDLWQEGIQKRLLFPIFHGREHLNVQRWMLALQNNHATTHLGFDCQVTGIPGVGINGEDVPNFQAAFDIDTMNDLVYMKEVLKTGLELFETIYGFRSRYFVPTNGPFNNTLELDLHSLGVEYINTAKKQHEPLGEGNYKTNIRFIGNKNKHGQHYITRNCFFEPSSSGFEWPTNTDWVNNCLKEISIAFRWHKPAVISSHRVNYIGFHDPKNRENSLKKFEILITQMLKKWPDIEFMTSTELGDLISNKK